MEGYIRKVNYHETDKMGITHHSNYVKWMEEARVDFLDKVGYGYAKLESEGIASPVLSVEVEYKRPTTFGDTIRIDLRVADYNGVRFTIGYTGNNVETGAVVFTAKSTHCFVGENGRPMILKRQFPGFDSLMREMLEQE